MNSDEISKAVYEICLKRLKPKSFKLFLFGSRANNRSKPNSDFDFYIDSSDLSDDLYDLIIEDLEKLETLYKIDLINWQKTNDDFKEVVLSEKVQEVYFD